MGFNLSFLENININKPKKDDVDLGMPNVDIEDVVNKRSNNSANDEYTNSSTQSELESVEVPIKEDNEEINASISDNSSEDNFVYRPSELTASPLEFKNIKDKRGHIKSKLLDFELKTRLTCIPFSLAKIPKGVVEIQDYYIFKVGNEKYASSSVRISDKGKVDMYIDNLKDMIETNGEFAISIMKTFDVDGKTITTMDLNKTDIDYILSVFAEANAYLQIKDGDVLLKGEI